MVRAFPSMLLASLALAAPASAEMPKWAKNYLKAAPQPPRQCQTVVPSFVATAGSENAVEVQYSHWVRDNRLNPWFEFNGRTEDLRFKCKQYGPLVRDGVEWFVQDIEYLRPKAVDPARPLLAINVVRLCALQYVRVAPASIKLVLEGQERDIGPKGCWIYWKEDIEAPILPAGQPSG